MAIYETCHSDTTNYQMECQMNTLDYEALGIKWETESVSRVFGPNQSDKQEVNDAAQIAVMTDVARFDAAFPGYILAMSNGTSLRVKCQSIGRKFNGRTEADREANRAAVMASLKGVRIRATSAPKRPIPGGEYYHGTNETEYRQLCLAAYVDQGFDSAVASKLVALLPF